MYCENHIKRRKVDDNKESQKSETNKNNLRYKMKFIFNNFLCYFNNFIAAPIITFP